MPEWLISAAAFVVAIGVLVAVHEFGHFWVARRLGVRVLRYSIGFGRKLWGWTSTTTGTEYWIAAVPLGGYVKMLDEREGPVPETQRHLAFNRQPVISRIAIVAAGPGINFLFAIFAYWLVLMLGVAGMKPVIGEVPPNTPAAAADLSQGARVLSVAGESVPTWQDLRLRLLDHALSGGAVEITVETPQGEQRRTVLDLAGMPADPKKLFSSVGLQPYRPATTPVIAGVVADSPAAAAGLQPGDRVLAADGEPMHGPQALVQWIQERPGRTVSLTVERDGHQQTISAQLAKVERDGDTIGRLGARIGVDAAAWEKLRTVRHLGPLQAIPAAVHKTWSVTSLTVRLLWGMVRGEVSWRNISGPIQIASYAGQTASIGLAAFLSFLALVSVSLAVLNLLPIPVLDGGHLLYYAVEIVRGRPLSEQAQAMGQSVGMAALLLLMGLAFYNDILRLLG